LAKRLGNADYHVMTANNGVDAVRMMDRHFYDVVLTDLMIPGGVDGIGVLESAKERNYLAWISLIRR
jgi:CheY-like chemotaxis protein